MGASENPDFQLELSPSQMRELVEKSLDRILPFIASLPRQAAKDTEGGADLARSVIEPLPQSGTGFEQLLDLLFEKLIPKSFNTAGPGYLAYIPGGGLFHSAVADLISNAVNRYVGVWAAAPGLAQLEANVIDWFKEIVGYPEEGRGFLTSGGSLANLSAVITARLERLPEDFSKGIVYVSDQSHHSVLKAALLAGIPARSVRQISSDAKFRIKLKDLERAIEADRKRGLLPFLIVAGAGTTNSGAVDDLDGLADMSAREGLWLHVDAAYGGFFMLTDQGRAALRGLARADSVTLDPHKGLFLPYGTGSLLVRDGAALKRTHSVHGAYMPPLQEDARFIDFCEISPELSRSFRGLRVWLPFKLHGIEPFRRSLEEKLFLTRWALDELRKVPGIEIVAEPQLSILAFRYRPDGLTEPETNRLNQDLLERINRRKRVYLTPTVLENKFVIRICVLSFRTHLDRMEQCLEDIRSALAEMSP